LEEILELDIFEGYVCEKKEKIASSALLGKVDLTSLQISMLSPKTRFHHLQLDIYIIF